MAKGESTTADFTAPQPIRGAPKIPRVILEGFGMLHLFGLIDKWRAIQNKTTNSYTIEITI